MNKTQDMPLKLGEKSISTDFLYIKQNIMTWDNTIIQLSNVSFISADKREPLKFPLIALGLILLGFVFFEYSIGLALVLLVIGGVWAFYWYSENQRRAEGAVLTIRMNSGHTLYFDFKSKEFLNTVVDVLEHIIIDGCTVAQNIEISIKNSKISGNASVLSNLKV